MSNDKGWSNDNQPEPPKQNGNHPYLVILGLLLIVAMVVALLQNMDTQWPIP